MEEQALTTEFLQELIQKKNVIKLREIFESTPAIDLAELANEFEDVADILFIFKTINSEYTAEFFSWLNYDQRERLMHIFTDKQLMELIENSYTDDIVDFLEDMPANLVSRILKNADKATRESINKLLNYKDNTAGSIMTTEYVELKSNLTVEDALAKIRKIGRDAVTIYTTFVIDSKRNLVGALYLDDLLFAEPETKIEEIMNEDFLTVHVNTDQEEVANLFKRYDKTVVPVLNDDNRMIGVITVDDIMDVIEQETTEDISHMAAVKPLDDSYSESSIIKIAKSCAPWLMALMVLGVFSAIILNRFEHTLAQVVILTAFIPTLMDTGGNAGNQSATLITRALALDEFDHKDFLRIVWKETRVALIVSLIVGVFAFFWVFFEIAVGLLAYDTGYAFFTTGWFIEIARIAGLIGLTLFTAILIGKIVGAALPLLARALKKDPALMATPFVTTIVDVTALLVYFFFSSAVFNLV